MDLEVEYMMEYQHPGLLVTEDGWLQRKPTDSIVMDKKMQLFHISLPATRNWLQSIPSPIAD